MTLLDRWCRLPGWVRAEAPLVIHEEMARRLGVRIAAEMAEVLAHWLVFQRAATELAASCRRATRAMQAYNAAARLFRTQDLTEAELAEVRRRGPGRVH